jgi:adenylate cyclase
MDQGTFKRKLTTIFSTDAVGYSKLMGDDEVATVKTITAYQKIMTDFITQHRGRVIDSPGDNLLAEFGSVVDAVQCAVAIQNELQTRNDELRENRRMLFRIGINLGDVIQDGERIYGNGVNITARLEGLAEAGGICISRSVYDQVKNISNLQFEYLGEKKAKNISDPIFLYKLLLDSNTAAQKMSNKLTFPDKPSIAVLPFENMSADPEQEFFCDGITEEIITGLASVPQLFVIARNSSFAFKGRHEIVQKISEELGVKYILEGSVRKSLNRIRITAQLIEATSGNHLWAERYDRELTDIFTVQDQITMKIVTALQTKLTVGEQARLWARRTNSLDAFLKYLHARSHFAHGKLDNYPLVRQIAEEAISFDENYSVPYVLIAWTHYYDGKQGSSESREKSFEMAESYVRKAEKLDDSYPDTHILMGFLFLHQKKFEEALIAGRKAIVLGPNNAEAHMIMAHILRFTGEFENAALMVNRALRLEPHYPSFYLSELAMCQYYTGRHAEAVESAMDFLRMAEDRGDSELLYFGHAILAMNYVRLNRLEDARLSAKKVLHYFPKYTLEWDRKASFYKYPEHLEKQHDDLRKAEIS